MISKHTIEILIEGGKLASADELKSIECLNSIKKEDHINRLHWSDWDKVTKTMDTDNLIALVKGLTIAELSFHWIGGSVSAVIWTFREVQRRDTQISEELADWILQQTNNPYAPFGTHNHGARSFVQYRESIATHQRGIARGLAELKESEITAKEQRRGRSEQKAKAAQDRNTEVRTRFLEGLNRMSIEDQVNALASDTKYSVEFYPTYIAYRMNQELINALDPRIKEALLIKLKGRRRGPWKKVKKLLLNSYRKNEWDRSTPWDRKKWF